MKKEKRQRLVDLVDIIENKKWTSTGWIETKGFSFRGKEYFIPYSDDYFSQKINSKEKAYMEIIKLHLEDGWNVVSHEKEFFLLERYVKET